MMHRPFFSILALVALAACAPPIPEGARIAEFENSPGVQRDRDAALSGSGIRVPDTVLPPAAGSAEATAAETSRILAQTRPVVTQAPLDATSPPPSRDNPALSDENDFDAVAERQTIQSDADRLATNRAQYQVVQPQALPDRPRDDQPNIVAFALSTSHPVGQNVYARAGLGGESRAARNCAGYASADLAQIDFLSRGGPARDRRGIDPDGDGYACAWDPTPFRKASEG